MIRINNVSYEVIPVGDRFMFRMEQSYDHSSERYTNEEMLDGDVLIDFCAALVDSQSWGNAKLAYGWYTYYLSGYIDVQHLSVNVNPDNAKKIARYIHDTVRGII